MKKSTAVILLLCASLVLKAQENVFLGGIFPEMAITHAFNEKYQTTFKIESQHLTYDDRLTEEAQWQYNHYRTDFQFFGARKLNPFLKLSVGYQYRLDGGNKNHNRLIQQLTYVQKVTAAILGHRLRLDQTLFSEASRNLYRVRYRFSAKFPLTGQSIQPGEYYLLTSNELLIGTQNGQQEVENRLVCSLGFYFGERAKLEGGLDWRTDKFISDGFRQRLWLKIGCYLNI